MGYVLSLVHFLNIVIVGYELLLVHFTHSVRGCVFVWDHGLQSLSLLAESSHWSAGVVRLGVPVIATLVGTEVNRLCCRLVRVRIGR